MQNLQQKQESEKDYSNKLNKQQDEALQEFNQKDEEQGQQQSFEVIQEILKILPGRVEEYNRISNMTKFQQSLVEDITQQMNTLIEYKKNVKIYIVFMGTISAGKSTFINALLGQQLLPSKNQSCTSQVTFIGHQNAYYNEDTKITINGQEFKSLMDASQQLTKIQEEPMGILNIKTQSYFHTTLDKDLQERVIFIDTPGIELSKTTPKQYLEHFGTINSLIQQDEYSIRINFWISNYTTFDSDKELQKNMNFMSKNEAEQIGNQNNVNQEQQQRLSRILKKPSSEFFYILNKYEQGSGDDPKENVFQKIKDSFNSDNVFMISAQNALQFNVMTYGTNEAQNKFIQTHNKDHWKHLSYDFQKATKKCEKQFKDNRKLFDNQDFNKLTALIQIQIQKSLVNLFEYKLEQLEKVIAFFNQSEQLMNAKEQHFGCLQDKMSGIKEQAEQHKYIRKISELQLKIEEEIRHEQDIIEKCQNNSKIYIVFMGTLSSGKSTFINSLLGQKLLPSNPTSQVTYIEHLNKNANSNTNSKITINEQEFDSLQQATNKLTEIQVNTQMGTVNIQTQSHFHSACLRKDLQERVVFIDTPGIELSKTFSDQYIQQHISEINQLIKLDESSIRINLWILNFDSEVNELQINMLRIQNEIECFENRDLSSQQEESQDQITPQNSQSVSFFYIINKFDMTKVIEGTKGKAENIKSHLNSQNIFMISAQDALIYNNEAEEYQKNPYLIELQDFNIFTSQISLDINNQLNNLVEQRLQRLNKIITQMDSKKQQIKEIVNQYKQLMEKINQLQGTFGYNLKSYNWELNKKNTIFFQQIEKLIDLAISQIDSSENQPVIETTCLNIISKIEKQAQHFPDTSRQWIEMVKDQLRLEFQVDPDQISEYNSESQRTIQFFLNYKISQQKEQFVKKQVDYVYNTMYIRSYNTFLERILNWLGQEYKLSQDISGSVSQCAYIAHYYVNDNSYKNINKDKLKIQMREWKGILEKDFNFAYNNELLCITQAMNKILNKFMTLPQLQLNEQQSQVFDHHFHQKLSLLEFGPELTQAKQQLTQQQKAQITEFLNTFPLEHEEFEQKLEILKGQSFNSIRTIIELGKNKIAPDIQLADHKQLNQQIYEETVDQFQKLSLSFFEEGQSVLDNLKILLLQQGDNQGQQFSIIIQRCESILQKITEDQTQNENFQFVQNQGMELYSNIESLFVNRTFFQRAGDAFQTTGQELKRVYSSKEIEPLVKTIQLAGIFVFSYLSQQSTRLNVNPQIPQSQLDDWEKTLNQQIKQLANNYSRLFEESLIEISLFLKKIIQ